MSFFSPLCPAYPIKCYMNRGRKWLEVGNLMQVPSNELYSVHTFYRWDQVLMPRTFMILTRIVQQENVILLSFFFAVVHKMSFR